MAVSAIKRMLKFVVFRIFIETEWLLRTIDLLAKLSGKVLDEKYWNKMLPFTSILAVLGAWLAIWRI